MDSLKHHYTFDYDSTIQCVCVSWHGHSTESQLRAINRLFLEFIKEHKVSKIIHDVLIMSEIPETYKKWLAEEHIPELYAAGVRYSAVIYPIRHIDVISLNSVVEEVTGRGSITTKYFTLIDHAKDWLKNV